MFNQVTTNSIIKLLVVNDVNVAEVTHDIAVKTLQASPANLRLTVSRVLPDDVEEPLDNDH